MLNLEDKELTPYEIKKRKLQKLQNDEYQISLFEMKDDELRSEISDISVDDMTPIEALNRLNELKRKVNKDNK